MVGSQVSGTLYSYSIRYKYICVLCVLCLSEIWVFDYISSNMASVLCKFCSCIYTLYKHVQVLYVLYAYIFCRQFKYLILKFCTLWPVLILCCPPEPTHVNRSYNYYVVVSVCTCIITWTQNQASLSVNKLRQHTYHFCKQQWAALDQNSPLSEEYASTNQATVAAQLIQVKNG